jgi:hypothetical protein
MQDYKPMLFFIESTARDEQQGQTKTGQDILP